MATAAFKTIKVKHSELGEVKVKVDAEDFDTLKSKNLQIQTELSRDIAPRVSFIENGKHYQAHRFILQQNKLLEAGRHYSPKNGDFFDLRKKNYL